ncbi:hypothetical protein DYI37_07995 [Fulvimarina endophytica]|uniref:TauD/TfdA-like domain-containing protein n=1 Tax=Fulvimarina endophytica TaxID=2293836 RepID=A0A371X4W5_9HYPH|nr:TauD/TfdA family dioxygenase [Fulvimarina endophytica]RFC64271.1 hypothetical protein DYI37_07995 [Fulvimarina endophytica]
MTRLTTYDLTGNERNKLEALAGDIPYPRKRGAPYADFVVAARTAVASALDLSTLRLLDTLKNGACPPAPVSIENLPFDPNVRRGLVDPEGQERGKASDLSEALLVGFTALLGEPYGIASEGAGLVSNLSPKRSHLEGLTGLGARQELSPHVENAFARLLPGDRAPDGLALIGVSPEPGTGPGTLVSDGRAALELVGPKVEAILRDPEAFTIAKPERWRGEGGAAARPTAIVHGPSEAPSFVAAFYGDMLAARTKAGADALAAFRQAIDAVTIDVHVTPGRLVFIDNHRLLHGRRSFEARFDETGRPYRWVQRCFYTSTLRRFGEWPRIGDRVIDPRG